MSVPAEKSVINKFIKRFDQVISPASKSLSKKEKRVACLEPPAVKRKIICISFFYYKLFFLISNKCLRQKIQISKIILKY